MYRVIDSSDYKVLTSVSEVVASSMVAGGSSTLAFRLASSELHPFYQELSNIKRGIG